MLGSGDEGTAAVVEYTPWRFAVRQAEDDWIATTNHFNHPEMARHHAQATFLSSTERLGRIGTLCSADAMPARDADAVGRVLLDRELTNAEANEYCTVWNPCTIYSTVFEPAQHQLRLRVADRADRQFESIALRGAAS